MENWQLTLTILASVLTGAMVPLLILASIAVHKASGEIGRIGERLDRTLIQVEAVSGRVETLSRGISGAGAGIGGSGSAVANPAGMDRNAQIISAVASMLATAVPLVAAFIKPRAEGQTPEIQSERSETGDDQTGSHPA